MAIWLKQSTAVTVKIGPFLDETDGKTAETALTIAQADVRLSKNGGDIAQKNNATACTHDELGYYDCPLSTTDTNTLGILRLMVHEAGALPVWQDFMVLPANVYDALVAGSDALQVHANEITAGLITATAIADNALTAAKIATGAITSAKFAAGAIDAAAVAADAVTEIAVGILDQSILGHETPASVGGLLAAASLDPWEQSIASYGDVGTFGKELGDFMDAGGGGGGGGATAAEIVDALLDEPILGHVSSGSVGQSIDYAAKGGFVDNSPSAAVNMRKFFDGTGYNAANSAIGAVAALSGTMDANLINIGGDSDLFDALEALLDIIVLGTVVAGNNTSTSIATNLTFTADDRLVGRTLSVRTGSRAKEGGKLITAYDGSTKVLTVEEMTGPLSPNDTFMIVG
jgi:hypothetical protein